MEADYGTELLMESLYDSLLMAGNPSLLAITPVDERLS